MYLLIKKYYIYWNVLNSKKAWKKWSDIWNTLYCPWYQPMKIQTHYIVLHVVDCTIYIYIWGLFAKTDNSFF